MSNRKLGRTTDHRLAMLKTLTTSFLLNGKVETTEAKAKELKAVVEKLITLAIKEQNSFTTAEKKVSYAKLDANGRKVLVDATSKNGRKYKKVERETVTKTVEIDLPSRLAARRKMFGMINKIKDKDGKNIDITAKLFGEYANKYKDRTGGYTRILKLGQRRGDAADIVILELV
jgi:large subunit ribosomal protein L17